MPNPVHILFLSESFTGNFFKGAKACLFAHSEMASSIAISYKYFF